MKNKKKFKYIKLLITIIFIIIIALCFFYNDYKNRKINEEIKEIYYQKEDEKDEEENSFQQKFDPLLKINKDVIGWIRIPETNIDYPVLKTNNNDYYLRHNIMREKTSVGSIFMDFRNKGDGTDRHSIIYGHRTNNKTMFTGLMNYKDKEFFYRNNIIIFNILEEEIKWEIFSAYITSIDFYYIITKFNSDQEFLKFINMIQDKSEYKTDVVLEADDKILTLSTCTYELEDARFVIHARRIN
ncbi:MAG: class B sortase [Bacilli bacterium]